MASLVKEKEVSLEAGPILEDAVAAMKSIKAKDISVLKSLSKPPEMVKQIMTAVCILNSIEPKMGVGPSGQKVLDYWQPAKKFLASPNFLNTLIEFDAGNVSETIITKIRKDFISNPQFSPENAVKISTACAGLCRWVIAVEKYDRAVRTMAPKKTTT